MLLNVIFLIGLLIGFFMIVSGSEKVAVPAGEGRSFKRVWTRRGKNGYWVFLVCMIFFILRFTLHLF